MRSPGPARLLRRPDRRPFFFQGLRQIAGEGVAIIMISSEMPELVMNAERVLVLRNGRVSGELTGAGINEEAILARAMAS